MVDPVSKIRFCLFKLFECFRSRFYAMSDIAFGAIFCLPSQCSSARMHLISKYLNFIAINFMMQRHIIVRDHQRLDNAQINSHHTRFPKLWFLCFKLISKVQEPLSIPVSKRTRRMMKFAGKNAVQYLHRGIAFSHEELKPHPSFLDSKLLFVFIGQQTQPYIVITVFFEQSNAPLVK